MRQWYSFYASNSKAVSLISDMEEQVDIGSVKLKQVASEITESKLKQVVSELMFPAIFAFVPWKHHVELAEEEWVNHFFYVIHQPLTRRHSTLTVA